MAGVTVKTRSALALVILACGPAHCGSTPAARLQINIPGLIGESEHGGEHGSSSHGEEPSATAHEGGHGEDSLSQETSPAEHGGGGHGEETSTGGHEQPESSGGHHMRSGVHGQGTGLHHSGGGGGHHGGGHSVSMEERSIAYLMMFSVSAIMVLLFFLNYSDPDVRCASSKMACTAVSVYVAVLINQAGFSFIFDQLLIGKDFRGLNMEEEDVKPWMRVTIGGFVFLLALLGLNVVCWRWQNRPNRLVAASQLGAHLVAWAGINAFGTLNNSDEFQKHLMADLGELVNNKDKLQEHGVFVKYIIVIVLGFIVFIVIFQLSRVIRMQVLDKTGEYKSVQSGKGPKKPDKKAGEKASAATKAEAKKPEQEEREPHWLEELGEAEREAMALVLGFLTQQTVVYLITGRVHIPIHGLHDKRRTHEVVLMAVSAWLVFGILLVVAIVWRKPGRSTVNFRGYLAMTMAWLFERSGEWFMHIFFDNLAFARIWSAFVLTGFAIVATVVIDHFADGSSDRKRRGVAAKSAQLEELIALDKFYEMKEEAEERERTTENSEENPLTTPGFQDSINGVSWARLEDLHKDLRDNSPTDLSVQTLTVGFSVLMGIVWDMAFESAEAIIVSPSKEEIELGHIQGFCVDHPVIARCLLAVFLSAIVLPGWIYYIVPPARKAWRHHLEDILLSQRQVPSKHRKQGDPDDDE